MAGAVDTGHRRRIKDYLAGATMLPLDATTAYRAAETSLLLRNAGLTIGAPDCMVAGTALVHGLPLLTRDVREFERVPGIAVLTVGPSG